MRFLYIKNEQICFQCGATLIYNDEAVVVRVEHSNGYTIPQFFHPECFMEWSSSSFMNRLTSWKMSAEERPPRKRKPRAKIIMGRPKKYSKPIIAGRLRASISYHRKAGNEDRVRELEEELKLLTIDKR